MTTFTDSNSNKLKFSGDTNPDNQIDTPLLGNNQYEISGI